MTPARLILPMGIVPELRDFTKHLWRFRGEDGRAVVEGPPTFYTLVVDDLTDAELVKSVVDHLHADLEFGTRVTTEPAEGVVRVCFRDIETLHTFLVFIGTRATRSDLTGAQAKEYGAFVMETLGFSWE